MIILTGYSGGIGRSIVKDLLKIDQVLGIYNSTKLINSNFKNFYLEKMDITNSKSINKFIKKWKRKLNKITLVNLAVQNKDGFLINSNEADWKKIFSVNLMANLMLAKKLIPLMMKQSWGRVIHISSTVGEKGVPGIIPYAASKSGLIGMSRSMAKEYGRFGITSNVLVLGYFKVGLIKKLSIKMKKKVIEDIPSGKLGDPVNIVNAIHFLIKSNFVNGSNINIDGGI